MIDVFFKGSGTWFDMANGELIYPLIDKALTYYSLPPVHQISGTFSISAEDAEVYKHTSNLDHVCKLFPNNNLDSAFLKMVDDGIFSLKNIEHYFFKLPRKRKKPEWSKLEQSKPILVIAKQVTDTTSPPKDKLTKLKSLRIFISEFATARKNKGLEFDSSYMKCNEEDLLTALKKWAKNQDKETQELWNIKKLSNLDIWPLDERKQICGLLPRGKNGEREVDFFKIVGF